MRKLFLIISPFLLLSFVSCGGSDSNSTGTSETGQIIPLSPYSVWVYSKTEYNLNGSVKKQSTDSIQVLPDTKLNSATGITWYDYNHELRAANISDKTFPGFWRVREDLVYPQLWFKYPANVGESFRWGPITQTLAFPTPQKLDSVVQLTGDFTVTAKYIPENVPAGSFNCYQYQSDFKDDVYKVTYLRTVDYLSPNIGQIMKEEYARDQSNTLKLISTMKLVSYHIN